MKNWKVRIKNNPNFLLVIFLSTLSFVSCEQETKVDDVYIAEVGKSKLTERELNTYLVSNRKSDSFKNDFIKSWIETEVLKQLAEERKILNDSNYTNVLNESYRELAAALMLKDILAHQTFQLTDQETEQFFTNHKHDYQSLTDVYIVNYAAFNDETTAINFRNTGITANWKDAVDNYQADPAVIELSNSKVYKDFHIQSKILKRILKEQYQNEISPVVRTELNNFVVVQQLSKIEKGKVPPFKFVKDKVRDRMMMVKQKLFLENYLDSLVTEKKVKIY